MSIKLIEFDKIANKEFETDTKNIDEWFASFKKDGPKKGYIVLYVESNGNGVNYSFGCPKDMAPYLLGALEIAKADILKGFY